MSTELDIINGVLYGLVINNQLTRTIRKYFGLSLTKLVVKNSIFVKLSF
jgi:hypothetical protein